MEPAYKRIVATEFADLLEGVAARYGRLIRS